MLRTILALGFIFSLLLHAESLDDWTPAERGLIDGLRIDHLGAPPPDPSNRFADHPKAVVLGAMLFNDERFSANGQVSCASCHRAEYNFTDDLRLGEGVGTAARRTMPIEGMAYQTWYFWDGRADSLWAQALAPLANAQEHGIDRFVFSDIMAEHYAEEYEELVGPFPEKPFNHESATGVFVNGGKAIAAFVRTLKPTESAFDRYARALRKNDGSEKELFSDEQKRGLRLFVSKAKCINCHNGPLFSNGEFHNVGTPQVGETDRGRAAVIEAISEEEFNCYSQWSDAEPETDCAHLDFLDTNPLLYEKAFKTPSLRNVADRSPFMHAGQFTTLEGLLQHYQMASGRNGVDEIFHRGLSSKEHEQLIAFLEALSSVE